MALSIRHTMAPAARIPANSSGPLIDMGLPQTHNIAGRPIHGNGLPCPREMFPGSIRLDKTTPRLAMMFVSHYD
jgi:hypothetical protein